MFKKKFFLFGCTILYSLCLGQRLKISTTRLNSLRKISFPVSYILVDSTVLKSDILKTFVYQDSLYYGHPVFINSLKTKLLLNAPTFLWQGDEYKTLYLIYPGEKINIRMGVHDNLIFSVDGNIKRTNELAFFGKLITKFGPVYNFAPTLSYHFSTKNLDSLRHFEKDISDTKYLRLQFLDSFNKSSPVSDNFFNIALNTIECTALKDSLLLYWSNKKLLDTLNLYKLLIAKKIITFNQINYQPYLIYFNTCVSLVSLSTSDYLHFEMINTNDFINRYQFIENNFAGITEDFLLANTIYTAFKNSIEIPKKFLKKFYSECKDQTYKRQISNKLNEKQAGIIYSKRSNALLFGDGKTVKNIKEVFSHFKGRLLLVDFWASWCSPCRAEMSFSKKLKKEYEKKNISFLYISTDESQDDWYKAQQEENLDVNNSFLLLNGNNSIFAKQNKIQAIPRYMLFGKDGKLINSDVSRPSDAKLKILIDKILRDSH